MRWRGVGDGCEEQEGRGEGEMGVADSAGELKEGTVVLMQNIYSNRGWQMR